MIDFTKKKTMKIKAVILVSFFLFANFAQCQIQKNKLQSFEKNGVCVRKRSLSFKKRIENFPFDSASQIVFVSHKTKVGPIGQDLIKYLDSVKIGQDTINKSEFHEIVNLNLKQIEELTDVIYNYGYKAKNYSISDTKCYDPRNAIIFLNKEMKIIAFIEICFGCDHLRTSDERISYGEYCEQKFELLKKIFAESGIKYGITERE